MSKRRQEPVTIAPLRLSVKQACQALNMSRAKFYDRVKDGKIKTHKDGGQTFVDYDELKRYTDSCRGTVPAESVSR